MISCRHGSMCCAGVNNKIAVEVRIMKFRTNQTLSDITSQEYIASQFLDRNKFTRTSKPLTSGYLEYPMKPPPLAQLVSNYKIMHGLRAGSVS